MDLSDRVREIIEPSIEALGFDVVRVMIMGDRRKTLQIMAERQDLSGMTVEDCAEISRTVSALLDVDDPVDTAYNLEVSSPGVDRPLTRVRDFERYLGFDAKAELTHALEGQRRFQGKILAVEGDDIVMETQEGTVRLPFADVRKAKLLMTDALLARALKEQED